MNKEEEIQKKNNKKKKKLKKLTFKQKQNRQVMWAIVLMTSIILIILTVPFIVNNFINKFTYINLDFQKTRLGEIVFYSARIPVTNIQGQVIGSYAINFRNDPRKLEYIEVDIPNKLVTFNKKDVIYITLNPSMKVCEDNIIAIVGLTSFLNDFGALEVKGAVTDKIYADETGSPYVNCENHPNNTVININGGNATKIKKTGDNCYELTYNNCEITQVTEKFSLVILENYMNYFKRKN